MKACPCCGAVQHSKGADARSLRTSAGPVRLSRRHLRCPDCRHSGYAVDDEVGLGGYLSRRLLRLACLSAADGSFAQASQHLHEYLALDVCAETLRAYCQKQGQHMAGWQPSSEAVAFAFAQAPGQPEFQMDAGKVNTPAGWRDLKIATFAKRPLAEPAEVADWASRDLPRPAARTMFAALEPIDTSQKRLRPQAARLGITEPSGLHVLGDGAEWVWNACASNFPGHTGTLDLYHAAEHLGTACKALHGEGTEASTGRLERGRERLLSKGWSGLCDFVAEELSAGETAERREALEGLMGYFATHRHRLGYRERLAEGRPIGSGLVEGAAKTLGLRLKARGARWLEGNVDKMAGLCCLRHSTFWDAYWTSRN